jgi:hypothetical protein
VKCQTLTTVGAVAAVEVTTVGAVAAVEAAVDDGSQSSSSIKRCTITERRRRNTFFALKKGLKL